MIINEQIEGFKLIPLKKESKIPMVQWNTDDELTFTGEETSYGIDTGRSNLIVIDCDVKNNIDGISNYFELVALHENGDTPNTFSVETPNGGMHFYYKNIDGVSVKNSASTLLKGVDVRAQGGYIVGPGSIIKNNEGQLGEYVIIDEDSIIEPAPQWLLSLLTKKGEKDGVKNRNNKNNRIQADHSDVNAQEEIEQKTALNWAISKMNQASPGERNVTLNHTAYFMGVKKVNINDARELMNIAMQLGLDENEASATFTSAYESGLDKPLTTLDHIIKEYNTKTGTSFKEDPMDTEFYSHVSLSYNFWLKFRNNLIYWTENSRWYEYNEKTGSWDLVNDDVIKTKVKLFLEELVTKIRNDKKLKIPAHVYKLQEKLWAKATIEAVASVAKTDFINRVKDLFDSEKELLNVKNGVYDMKKKVLLPHNSKFYITKHIPYNLNFNAKDKYSDLIIESIHPEQRDFMQLMAGQSLTGYQPDTQVAIFMFGRGSNGKSTFVDLMLRTNGTYGQLQTPSILLPEAGKENYALADFEGLRTVIIEELPDSKQLNSGALKRVVGTERINARAIYSSNREFINESTLFVSCNRLPMINDTDDGTWRRLLVVTFPYSYKKNAKDIKNKWDKPGDGLVLFAARKRTTTAEAFLAWRVRGAEKWLESPSLERDVPESIEESVIEWNENNDLFLAWANETLIKEQDSFILLNDAFDSFNIWLQSRGNAKVSLRFFIASFTNHKFFFDNQLTYVKKTERYKNFNHSTIIFDGIHRTPEKQENIFLNVAFQ